ncbi:MAG: AgmX/PglI C-terminal domain-containing protein [Proteobacteria bacterium]|nr:AgmX/PglI C-terminal domain-containing protein [Pseudomonadota bacterium]
MKTLFLIVFLAGCGSESAPPAPIAIATDAVVADEPISMDDVLAENRGVIEQCFRNELRENPKLAGRVEFEWLLQNHRAVQAQVVSSTFPEDIDVSALTTCVMEGSKLWHFPAGDGSIRYPITFTPMS